ncbi:SDR family NAD(P)-dependent oxidoreductase [Bordetella sp. BOR01]|uniref:SDR family NAD(P)-dependent oxidoreductase n=1 Tax=Bordetella sp. BOR01 TaxID=2854779 RepID=UPI001C48BFD1|nr:SDR family oxidoreductase [Bordetella sp. BOR01]MBV7484864.1 SDR family oxidoreductase [Bordetella sp. BOR01]
MSNEKNVAVVTGAASGIGKATVLALVRKGVHVCALDIDREGAARLVAQPEAAGSVEYFYLDLESRDSVLQAAAQVLEKHRNIDVIVNTAGWDRIQPFIDNTPEFIDKVLSINLAGPVLLTQALLPSMIAANRGKIVNIASDAGRVGSMGETVYAAAKGGVIAFTKSLAREISRYQIHVNCICPGPTDTPLFHAQPEKLKEALVKAIPFRRLAKPEETANAILFFAGAESDYVTAQVLSVSGGLTMVG